VEFDDFLTGRTLTAVKEVEIASRPGPSSPATGSPEP
jgi:hypothetical protein